MEVEYYYSVDDLQRASEIMSSWCMCEWSGVECEGTEESAAEAWSSVCGALIRSFFRCRMQAPDFCF
jgi:hypothetical protein